nr:helix-turn-helix transcriptional regulator [Photobacterium alginatilyticum]
MHTAPERNWTIKQLAQEVGLSRSAFASHFHELVGQPPMTYLFILRMQLAKSKIEDTSTSMLDIAEQIGYKSESSFKKAFKRFFKKTPTSVRNKKKLDRDIIASCK